MKLSKKSILLLHNAITPYRVPLFNKLSEKLNLDILIAKENLSQRKWNVDEGKLNSNWIILKYIQIGLIVLNPGLVKRLIKKNYDIYIIGPTQEGFVSSLIILIYAKLKQKPILLFTGEFSTPSTYFRFATKKRLVLRKIFRFFLEMFIYKAIDAFIVYSNKTKKYLEKLGFNEDKIFVGTQFIPKKNLELQKKFKKPEKYRDKTITLFLSYFQKRKFGGGLIKVFKNINNNDSILIMAGDGPEKENWTNLAKGEKNIIFPGYADKQLKSYLYSVSDIYVLPTLWDVWGLVVNEAMMFGLPVIVSEAAGCSDELVENGKNGFTFDPRRLDELKNKLEYLIENENLRENMEEHSKKIIEDYDIDMAVNTFENALEYIINNR